MIELKSERYVDLLSGKVPFMSTGAILAAGDMKGFSLVGGCEPLPL